MLFCPDCDNILDISKNSKKKNTLIFDTPDNVSDSDNEDNEDVIFTKIITKILNDTDLNESELEKQTLLIKSTPYLNLNKIDKKKVDVKLEKLLKETDITKNAYFVCNNCLYSKIIDSKTLITSRVCASKTNNYINNKNFKNMIHNKCLPISRAYICVNKDCKSHIEHALREAVFYRIDMQVWYACKACNSSWKGE